MFQMYNGMIYHLLFISHGDRHYIEVADYLKVKLVEEYKTYSETVINSMHSS